MNKVVIVTGAQQGIGKTIAENFAGLGYDVVVNDKDDKSKLEKLKDELIRKYKVDVMVCFGDVSSEQFAKQMFKQVTKHFKYINALVNNAAIVEDMEILNRNVQTFNKTLTNNAASVYIMSKLFGQYMFENKSGKIINISSTNGDKTLYPTSIDYDASKAAINSLTKNFAIQFAPFVNVNAVMPAWVMTEMNMQLDKKFLEKERKRILLKKFQTTQDIANAVEFLASEKAASITGVILPVDGGLSII